MSEREFDVNRRGRDFVVGDLHGQLSMLNALLRTVSFDPKQDRLFSVGDLIDRGPNSLEVFERFSGGAGFFAIRGNHEVMLIGSDINLTYFKAWQLNGGMWALSLSLQHRLALAAAAKELPLTIALELADGRRIGLVHAEVPPGKSWDEACAVAMSSEDLWDTDGQSTAASLVWGRRRFLALEQLQKAPELTSLSSRRQDAVGAAAESVPGIDLVICGHSIIASRQPARLGNTLFIDTGAYEKKGRLTMLEPLTGLYWQCRHQGLALKVNSKPQRVPL